MVVVVNKEIFAIALAFGCLAAWALACARLERDAYERVTGKDISTYDALFLDLRVEAQPRGE